MLENSVKLILLVSSSDAAHAQKLVNCKYFGIDVVTA